MSVHGLGSSAPRCDVVSELLIPAQGTAGTSVPVWFTIAVGVAGPLLVLLGVVIGHYIARRGARELDQRARREELLRMVRWSAEHVTKGAQQARVALAMLEAAGASSLLQDGDQRFIDAIVDTVLDTPVEAYHTLEDEAREEAPRND